MGIEDFLDESEIEETGVNQICKLMGGYLAWNVPKLLISLDYAGYRKVKIKGKSRYMFFGAGTMNEIGFEEIKEFVMAGLNCRKTQEERRFLLENDAFFSPTVLNGISDAFPDLDHGDHIIFLWDRRRITVYEDGDILIEEEE